MNKKIMWEIEQKEDQETIYYEYSVIPLYLFKNGNPTAVGLPLWEIFSF